MRFWLLSLNKSKQRAGAILIIPDDICCRYLWVLSVSLASEHFLKGEQIVWVVGCGVLSNLNRFSLITRLRLTLNS